MRLIGNACHFLEKIQEEFLSIHVYILQAKMKVTFTIQNKPHHLHANSYTIPFDYGEVK